MEGSGRVEMCFGDQWGTVCDDAIIFDRNAPSIICRQLGFPGEGNFVIRFELIFCQGGNMHNGVLNLL